MYYELVKVREFTIYAEGEWLAGPVSITSPPCFHLAFYLTALLTHMLAPQQNLSFQMCPTHDIYLQVIPDHSRTTVSTGTQFLNIYGIRIQRHGIIFIV